MREFQDRLMLPWTNERKENQQFSVILCGLLVLLLIFSIWIPLISLPEVDRESLEKLPPQLAKLVLNKKVAELKKVEEPVPIDKVEEEPEPVPEQKDPVKEKIKPKIDPKKETALPDPIVKKKPKQLIKAAIEVAKKTGLLALQDDLAELRVGVNTSVLSKPQTLRKEKTIAAKASGLSSKSTLGSSGGISTSSKAVSAESVKLAGLDREVLEETADEYDLAQAETEAAYRANERSEESIRFAIEKLKASFYKLYNRELRKDPFLEGRLILELVIEASGEVSYCRVVSSELNHKALESKIVNRMKLANFGVENVARATRQIPFVFQPK